MERDHRLHALLAELTEHVAVAAERLGIELAFTGLNTRPLNREAVGVVAHLAVEDKVLAVAVPGVAGRAGDLALSDPPGLLLELPPVVVAIVALDLVRGSRGRPEEPVWKGAGFTHFRR